MNLIFLLTLLNIIRITSSYNCLREPKNYPCPQNSYCNNSGICTCNTFYYRDNCQTILPSSNSLNLVTQGFNQSGYLGLIFGFTFTLPLFLVIGLIIIYYCMKDRDL